MVSKTNSEARDVANEFARWVTFQYHYLNEFLALFSGPEKRHELLEKTAIGFFNDVFWMYVDRIIQNVSKLTDHPKTGKHKNFSIRSIHEYFQKYPCYSVKDAEKLVIDIENKANKLRERRNKLLDHYDWDYAIGKNIVKEKFFPQDIEKIYTSLEKYVELLFSSVFNDVYDINAVSYYGVDELIKALKESQALRDVKNSDINTYSNLMWNSIYKDA